MILSLYNSNIFVRRKTVLLDETVQLLDRLGPAADAASKRDFKKGWWWGGGGRTAGLCKVEAPWAQDRKLHDNLVQI